MRYVANPWVLVAYQSNAKQQKIILVGFFLSCLFCIELVSHLWLLVSPCRSVKSTTRELPGNLNGFVLRRVRAMDGVTRQEDTPLLLQLTSIVGDFEKGTKISADVIASLLANRELTIKDGAEDRDGIASTASAAATTSSTTVSTSMIPPLTSPIIPATTTSHHVPTLSPTLTDIEREKRSRRRAAQLLGHVLRFCLELHREISAGDGGLGRCFAKLCRK